MKSGFKKLSKTELMRLRGGKKIAGAGCCTHTTANSDCTTSSLTCTINGVAVSVIAGKAYDKQGKFLEKETASLRAAKKASVPAKSRVSDTAGQ